MNGSGSLFSVVIPTYNRGHVVLNAINSILNQTYSNTEVIVVDDGSTDDTESIISKECHDERVVYIKRRHEGAQQARNYGLERSSGEYTLFLDSDDVLLPSCLEQMVKRYEIDQRLGAVYVLTGLRNDDGTLRTAREDYLEGDVYKEVLLQGYLTSTSFISMRRKIFDSIGMWDTNLPACQDDDMCFRISRSYKISLIRTILGIYGVGFGGQIGSSNERVANGWWLLWNKYENDVIKLCGKETIVLHYRECAERFKRIGLNEEYKAALEKINSISIL